MRKINKMFNPSCDNVFEFDKDFPLQFCPICGSEHLIGEGREQPLFNCKESWIIRCNTCNWVMEVFTIKKGKSKFKFRQDSVNCKKCHDFYDYEPKPKGLTNKLKRLIGLVPKNWMPPVSDETRLQCGWEDQCDEMDCHKCPRKHKVKLELTYAEICAIEDCAMVDLPKHQQEKPKVYELTQNIMHDLMKKVFKEIGE